MKTFFRNSTIATLAIVFLMFTAAKTFAAVNMYLEITDAKGTSTKVAVANDGSFKSPALKAGTYSWSWGVSQASRVNKIEAIVVHHEIVAPRDVASGQSTGKRQYQPVIIRKKIDKASPLLRKLGALTVDADCDGIKGTVEFKDAADKTIEVSSWDLGVQKK